MFLYGDQIVNDYNFKTLFNHLTLIKAVRGRDYHYFGKEQLILKPTSKIESSPLCYKYQVLSINPFHPRIGRYIDHKKKLVTDYVFDSLERYTFDKSIGPYTLGWTYDFNYTSVMDSIMMLVESIPIDKRDDKIFVISYICSRIDASNDPINGIIEGRWKSTFTGGREPFLWKNSSDVFREKIRLHGPVKYGQCWVLADLLTGILGYLGLKSRTVEIKNCIMDLYLTGGFDLACSTKDVFLKGGNLIRNSFDPRKTHIGNFSYRTNEKFESQNIISKGPLFDLNNEVIINPKDFYNLNHFIEDREGKTWNFHVWTECKVNNEWYVLDPSPLHDTCLHFGPYIEDRDHELLNKKKYFGPIGISNLKSNKEPNKLKNNFRYLYSCINGQIRTWCPLINDKKIVLYLNYVRYGDPQVYQKNILGKTLSVSHRYRDTYDNIHKNNPIYFMIKNNDLSKLHLYVRPHKVSLYVVQISFFQGNTPLYIHREHMNEISANSLMFLKHSRLSKYRLQADRFTVSIYDISSGSFWTQCIQM